MHLALKSAMSRIPYTNKVGETLGSIADSAAAYSLRALNGGDPMVARVRRSSDDAEKDFAASDVSGGALVDWVNEDVVTYQSDFSAGTNGWTLTSGDEVSTFTHSTNKVVLEVAATGTNSNRPVIVNSGIIEINQLHSISFSYNVTSGTCIFNGYFDGGAVDTSPQETLSGNGVKTFEFLRSSAPSVLALYFDSSNLFNLEITDIQITQLTSNGHVTTWYDQSGNGNNATQSTAGSQPKIVDGGVYLGELDFDVNTEDYLEMSPVDGKTIYALCSSNTADTGSNLKGLLGSSLSTSFNASYIFFSPNAGPFNSYAASLDGQVNDQAFWYLNGENKGSGGNIGTYGDVVSGQTMLHSFEYAANDPANNWRVLGAYFDTGAAYKGLDGTISEIIIYDSDQSANRAAIETNINNHYDIY